MGYSQLHCGRWILYCRCTLWTVNWVYIQYVCVCVCVRGTCRRFLSLYHSVDLFLHSCPLSLSLCHCRSLCVSVAFLSLCLFFISLPICISLSVFLCVCLSVSLAPSLSLYISPSLSLSLFLFCFVSLPSPCFYIYGFKDETNCRYMEYSENAGQWLETKENSSDSQGVGLIQHWYCCLAGDKDWRRRPGSRK